jgi:hypothetical protein
MSDTLVNVTTQYYENYDYPHNTTDWEPKGSFMFSIMVDFDYLMYSEAITLEAIKMLVADEGNARVKFEYISHEIVFNDIIKLAPNKFVDAFAKVIDSRNTDTDL